MNASSIANSDNSESWLCPNLAEYWQVGYLRRSQQYVLMARTGNIRYMIEAPEAYALQHFNGQLTVAQIQRKCSTQFQSQLPPDLVLNLLEKLVAWGVLSVNSQQSTVINDQLPVTNDQLPVINDQLPVTNDQLPVINDQLPVTNDQLLASSSPTPHSPFKACVEWIEHPEGYWILRNPEDVTFMQVDPRSKQALELLGKLPSDKIAQKTGIMTGELKYLMQLLAATGMLEGTKPPKPPKKPFTPLKLLFFKVPLFNPDAWLQRPAEALSWIWTKSFFWLLLAFLSVSAVVGLNLRSQILVTGSFLWQTQGATLVIPFGLLAMTVVTIHELGHALTLKHYGGIVPEIGFLFMFFMPAAYTNTSDSYCLVKRRQRVLVVGAGVLCQFIIGAIALWLWSTSVESSWLHPISYLLMVAALFTVAVNLNPMAKFDGYYLTVAATGINNLRTRSFQFYRDLLTGKPSPELGRDRIILAAYAPLSFLYIFLVFGSLFRLVAYWTFDNAPVTILLLVIGWAIYYFWPRPN